MYQLAAIVLSVGIPLFSLSYWLGKRKKVVDQLESDTRIFLTLILITSFYIQFLSIVIVYSLAAISDYRLNYVITSLYFLFPLTAGLFLYILLPWLHKRSLHLREIPVPQNVYRIGNLLQLSELPRVVTTSSRIPPLVYGRRRKSSVLVLPENFESLLTVEEQEAVIAHELSHVNQGDVGFFTWLTLLIEGLKYWILLFPFFVYFGIASYGFNARDHPVSVGLIVLFFITTVLLRNSLSRTRESIADAYAIFHGFEIPLKRALFKYAALRTAQKGHFSALYFYHRGKYGSVLATHPPLMERLHTIDKRTFLSEPVANLTPELAFWTGLVSAFLFYNSLYSSVFLLSVIETGFSVSIESALNAIWVMSCFLVMGVVGIPYIFPSTKGLVFVSDLSNASFVLPLLRNWGITVVTAAGILYGLTLDTEILNLFVPPVLFGFSLWAAGFFAAKYSDFGEKMWFILFSPLFIVVLLWNPVKVIYYLFSGSSIDLSHLAASIVVNTLLTLIIFLLLLESGHLSLDKEHLILIFGKTLEIPQSKVVFGFFGTLATIIVPTALSLGVYVISNIIDTFEIFPEMSIYFVVIPILLIYSFRRSDIIFFTEISYFADLLQKNIQREDVEFLQKIIEVYRSSDGGFDSAGLNFSKQKDTYYSIRTAEIVGIQLEKEKTIQWIRSTAAKRGFAIVPGGLPRVEGTYYAVESLSLLESPESIPCECVQWVHGSFNGEYFTFKNDTVSFLLQTCYAVELLFLLDALKENTGSCKRWIEKNFSYTLEPKEAFFTTRALKILNSDTELAEKWLKSNENLLITRLDKNLEAVYYYVRTLRELNKLIPPSVEEQAASELGRIRKKYKKSKS